LGDCWEVCGGVILWQRTLVEIDNDIEVDSWVLADGIVKWSPCSIGRRIDVKWKEDGGRKNHGCGSRLMWFVESLWVLGNFEKNRTKEL